MVWYSSFKYRRRKMLIILLILITCCVFVLILYWEFIKWVGLLIVTLLRSSKWYRSFEFLKFCHKRDVVLTFLSTGSRFWPLFADIVSAILILWEETRPYLFQWKLSLYPIFDVIHHREENWKFHSNWPVWRRLVGKPYEVTSVAFS